MIEKENFMCRKIYRWIWNDYLCFSIRCVFLEYPWHGYSGWFTWGKADSETVDWDGLWMATDLISVFLGRNPFLCDFLTYLGFSISSLILSTMLYFRPGGSLRKSHFLFGVYRFSCQPIKKIKLIDHYLATIPLTRSQLNTLAVPSRKWSQHLM